MDRAERQAEIEFIADSLQKTQVALCADSRGLTVSEVTQLRKELRQIKSNARVVKNTLARRAVEKAYRADGKGDSVDKFLGIFEGPSFVVFNEHDPVAPAKVMAKFAKEHEHFKIKGGWLEGSFVDAKGVNDLSQMPGREETLAKLLALMMAPATQLVRIMQEPSAQLVRLLGACRDKLEKEGKLS